MIHIDIRINHEPIRTLSARRIYGGTGPDSINTYEMTGFPDIRHRYGDGAEVLALKMLQAYVEGKS